MASKRGWPEVVGAGDGIELRKPDPIDAEAMCDAINTSLDHLGPWMPWATGVTTIDQQAVRMAVSAAGFEEGADAGYTIVDTRLTGSAAVVGSMGLHDRGRPDTLEIGYWLRPTRTGKGIATRAAAALVGVAFEVGACGRVEIRCDAANHRSAAVPQRLGFSLVEIIEEPRSAPADTNRTMIWEVRRSVWSAIGGVPPRP